MNAHDRDPGTLQAHENPSGIRAIPLKYDDERRIVPDPPPEFIWTDGETYVVQQYISKDYIICARRIEDDVNGDGYESHALIINQDELYRGTKILLLPTQDASPEKGASKGAIDRSPAGSGTRESATVHAAAANVTEAVKAAVQPIPLREVGNTYEPIQPVKLTYIKASGDRVSVDLIRIKKAGLMLEADIQGEGVIATDIPLRDLKGLKDRNVVLGLPRWDGTTELLTFPKPAPESEVSVVQDLVRFLGKELSVEELDMAVEGYCGSDKIVRERTAKIFVGQPNLNLLHLQALLAASDLSTSHLLAQEAADRHNLDLPDLEGLAAISMEHGHELAIEPLIERAGVLLLEDKRGLEEVEKAVGALSCSRFLRIAFLCRALAGDYSTERMLGLYVNLNLPLPFFLLQQGIVEKLSVCPVKLLLEAYVKEELHSDVRDTLFTSILRRSPEEVTPENLMWVMQNTPAKDRFAIATTFREQGAAHHAGVRGYVERQN